MKVLNIILFIVFIGLLLILFLQFNKDRTTWEAGFIEKEIKKYDIKLNTILTGIDQPLKIQELVDFIESVPSDQCRNRLSPIKERATVILGELYYQSKENKKAIKLYKKLTNECPYNYKYWFLMAESSFILEKFEQTHKYLNKALKIYPEHQKSLQLKEKLIPFIAK